MDPALFTRGQPASDGLIRAGNDVVTRTQPPWLVDVAAARAQKLELPGSATSVALAGGSVLRVLGRDASGQAKLFARATGGWKPLALPEGLALDPKSPTLMAQAGERLAVLAGRRLHLLDSGRWSSHDVPTRSSKTPGWPNHAALVGRRLFFGSDRGEWGGELSSLDLDRLDWRDEPAAGVPPGLELPVRDLALDAKGALWVVRGLSHLGLREGMLHRLDADAFTAVAWTRGPIGDRPQERGGDWNLGGTAFDAIAFDAEGRTHLLTGSLGLVRREADGRWSRLTPGWPDFVYVNGLAIVGSTAVLGSYDAGVVLYDLPSGSARAVALR